VVVKIEAIYFLFLLPLTLACSSHFRVLPYSPNYVLRSPHRTETAFPEILRAYNGFQPGLPSIDLRPQMELRIENAYYQKGSSRRGLDGFLGTEIARYEVTVQGLKLVMVQSMKERPADDVPVTELIAAARTHFRYYRFYYEVVFSHANNASKGSVLLGANSMQDLEQQPETVCNSTANQCVVFPEACSVSVEMKISVNGKPQDVVWGSSLASIVPAGTSHVEMRRLEASRSFPVVIRSNDADALRLPLLPGDAIKF